MEISLLIIIQPVRAMDMFPLVNIYKLSFCQLKWMNTGPFYKIQTSLSHLLNPPKPTSYKTQLCAFKGRDYGLRKEL